MSDNIFFDRSKLKYCGENVIIGKTVRIRKPEECIIGDGTIIDDSSEETKQIKLIEIESKS